MTDNTQGTIEEQLEVLYAEREWLAQELGCCDAEGVVDMVRNLECQLVDLYRTHGSTAPVSNSSVLALLQNVQELSQQLDGLYAHKSISFSIENDQPVVKATWSQNTREGDAR